MLYTYKSHVTRWNEWYYTYESHVRLSRVTHMNEILHNVRTCVGICNNPRLHLVNRLRLLNLRLHTPNQSPRQTFPTILSAGGQVPKQCCQQATCPTSALPPPLCLTGNFFSFSPSLILFASLPKTPIHLRVPLVARAGVLIAAVQSGRRARGQRG